MGKASAVAVAMALCLGGGAVATAASARPSIGNADATAAYLRAAYAFDSAYFSELPAERAAGAALVSQTDATCRGALRAVSVESITGSHFNEAVLEATAMAVLVPLHPAVVRFAEAIEPLHWTDASLTRGVRLAATSLRAEAAEAPPAPCQLAADWRATGFGEDLPASAQRLVSLGEGPPRHRGALNVERASARMRRYAGTHSRALMRRLTALQKHLIKKLELLLFDTGTRELAALQGIAVPPGLPRE